MKIYLQVTNNFISSFHTKETEYHTIEYEIEDSLLNDFINNTGKYYYINSKVVLLDIESKRKTISELKLNLVNTDYKITKCYEAFMRQLPLPYNLEELAAQRDLWRKEINQLEEELAELE